VHFCGDRPKGLSPFSYETFSLREKGDEPKARGMRDENDTRELSIASLTRHESFGFKYTLSRRERDDSRDIHLGPAP